MIWFKQGLGILGMAVGLAGVVLRNRMVVWVAVGLLAASLLIRIVVLVEQHRRDSPPDADDASAGG